ncbi:hypothetical protein RW092_09830 [Paenibacillus sp. 3LSP]|uniref:hypothetical protein n=1 Tax=Paenibacillus sp. 3LSP TaxID=2800795 RepID=UPI0028FD4878|nr:hypothetical protein [Paenibacillus sp. 3LSP]MDU0330502.1 hypothetical protein [Paenibacillus sp. 3LSP]
MNKYQRLVVKWFCETGQNFISDIAELEGGFDGVPDEVFDAFGKLSYKEQIEVIKEAANKLLSKTSA